MSNTNGQAPAGWYGDPSGSQQLRWWDGSRWTEHVAPGAQQAAPAQQAYSQAAYAQPGGAQPVYTQPAYATYAPERPQLAPGAQIYNVFIWVIVALPIVTYVLMLFWNPFANLPAIHSSRDIQSLANPFAFLGWAYFAIIIVGWLTYGLTVVFAWLDYRELTRAGVVRPFHWAWAFLSSIVYVIGRSVIVRRVAPGRGLVPIWASIAVIVVGFIVATVWFAMAMQSMSHLVPSYGSYGA